MDTTKELTHLSLCTGYGGIDLGLQRAIRNIRTICYVEIEAFAIANLVSKIEKGLLDAAPVWSNLKTFDWIPFRGKVDILSGGFPCQPFSSAGRRQGDQDPRHLWPHIIKGIEQLGRPPIIFLENVEGIISSKLQSDGWSDPKGTSVLHHVLRELERLGYKATAGVFSAREIGAPHQRKRVFIMGCRSNLGESGRALVSEMLERGGESSLGNTENKHPHGKLRSVYQKKGDQIRKYASGSTSGYCRKYTGYPAPRGAEQYEWEPPRVTVGNTNNNDSSKKSESRLSKKLADSCCERLEGSDIEERPTARSSSTRGAEQRAWEPSPVTVGNSRSWEQGSPEFKSCLLQKQDREEKTSEPQRTNHTRRAGFNVTREAQSAMGRDIDGGASRLDYAECSRCLDSRTDELRLLGNGVVPDTAQAAFKVLWEKLEYAFRSSEG